MSDDPEHTPPHPISEEQRRLRLAYMRRHADERQRIEQYAEKLFNQKHSEYEHIADLAGLTHGDDKRSFAKQMAWNSAIDYVPTTTAHERVDVYEYADDLRVNREEIEDEIYARDEAERNAEVARIATGRQAEADRLAQAKQDQEARTTAAIAEPIPGSVARFDAPLQEIANERAAARLGQIARMNNADMDMLTERGPHRLDYTALRDETRAAEAPEPAAELPTPAATLQTRLGESNVNGWGQPSDVPIRASSERPAIEQWLATYDTGRSSALERPSARPATEIAQPVVVDVTAVRTEPSQDAKLSPAETVTPDRGAAVSGTMTYGATQTGLEPWSVSYQAATTIRITPAAASPAEPATGSTLTPFRQVPFASEPEQSGPAPAAPTVQTASTATAAAPQPAIAATPHQPDAQPVPQPAPRDTPDHKRKDQPKTERREEPRTSAGRNEDKPTPIGEVTDAALLRVIKLDISMQHANGHQQGKEINGSQAVWRFGGRIMS